MLAASFLALLCRGDGVTLATAVATLSPPLWVKVLTGRRFGLWMILTFVIATAFADSDTSSSKYISPYLVIPVGYVVFSFAWRVKRKRAAEKVGLPKCAPLAGCSTPKEASERALKICTILLCVPFNQTRVTERLVALGIDGDAVSQHIAQTNNMFDTRWPVYGAPGLASEAILGTDGPCVVVTRAYGGEEKLCVRP